MARLAILGGGFMGGALAEGLIDSGWRAGEIIVAEKLDDRREHLRRHLQVSTTEDPVEASEQAEIVLFAVKPQDVEGLLERLRSGFGEQRLAISICAGVPTSTFERFLFGAPVIRAMPNTPAAIGLGATAIAPGRYANEGHVATAIAILEAVGAVVVVDETQMDAVTAVSGSGPAYVFYLAETLITAAQKQGLEREQARTLVYQTLVGAAQLLQRDPASPEELRARVTSAGGTTQAAIEHLQASDWAGILEQAVEKARLRSEELGS